MTYKEEIKKLMEAEKLISEVINGVGVAKWSYGYLMNIVIKLRGLIYCVFKNEYEEKEGAK